MWPFTRQKSSEDMLTRLRRNLVETPHEWTPYQPKNMQNVDSVNGLRHVSGVEINWGTMQVGDDGDWRYYVMIGVAGQWRTLPWDDTERLVRAMIDHLIARVVNRPRPFTDSAYALAKAIEAGDVSAAVACADEVIEYHGRKTPTPEDERA